MVQHIACRCHRAAIDMNSHIRVNTRIHTEAAAVGDHRTAVDHQPSVGVNAVALAGGTVDNNMQGTAVDCGHRNTVFIGIDTVIAGPDIDIAAV